MNDAVLARHADFSRLVWQSLTRAVLFLDPPEDLGEFTDRLIGSWRPSVTAGNRRNLRTFP